MTTDEEALPCQGENNDDDDDEILIANQPGGGQDDGGMDQQQQQQQQCYHAEPAANSNGCGQSRIMARAPHSSARTHPTDDTTRDDRSENLPSNWNHQHNNTTTTTTCTANHYHHHHHHHRNTNHPLVLTATAWNHSHHDLEEGLVPGMDDFSSSTFTTSRFITTPMTSLTPATTTTTTTTMTTTTTTDTMTTMQVSAGNVADDHTIIMDAESAWLPQAQVVVTEALVEGTTTSATLTTPNSSSLLSSANEHDSTNHNSNGNSNNNTENSDTTPTESGSDVLLVPAKMLTPSPDMTWRDVLQLRVVRVALVVACLVVVVLIALVVEVVLHERDEPNPENLHHEMDEDGERHHPHQRHDDNGGNPFQNASEQTYLRQGENGEDHDHQHDHRHPHGCGKMYPNGTLFNDTMFQHNNYSNYTLDEAWEDFFQNETLYYNATDGNYSHYHEFHTLCNETLRRDTNETD